MNIVQVEKSLEYISTNMALEDLYFLVHEYHLAKNNSIISRFSSQRVRTKTIDEIEKYIVDPEVFLIKFIPTSGSLPSKEELLAKQIKEEIVKERGLRETLRQYNKQEGPIDVTTRINTNGKESW